MVTVAAKYQFTVAFTDIAYFVIAIVKRNAAIFAFNATYKESCGGGGWGQYCLGLGHIPNIRGLFGLLVRSWDSPI